MEQEVYQSDYHEPEEDLLSKGLSLTLWVGMKKLVIADIIARDSNDEEINRHNYQLAFDLIQEYIDAVNRHYYPYGKNIADYGTDSNR